MPAYQPVQAWELQQCHGPRKGAQALLDATLFLFHAQNPKVDLYSDGIYNRRPMGSSANHGVVTVANASLHAVGRAIDFGTHTQGVGDILAGALTTHANALGVCEVIWWSRRWTATNGWQPYHGPDSHHTHVHVGMTIAMADNASSLDDLHKWFAANLVAPVS